MENVRTVSKMNLPIQSIRMEDLVRRFESLRGIPVDSYDNAVPQVIIGLNNVHLGLATRAYAPSPDQ